MNRHRVLARQAKSQEQKARRLLLEGDREGAERCAWSAYNLYEEALRSGAERCAVRYLREQEQTFRFLLGVLEGGVK